MVSNADYGAGWSIMPASLVGGGQRRARGGEAVEQLTLLPLFLVVALASLVLALGGSGGVLAVR